MVTPVQRLAYLKQFITWRDSLPGLNSLVDVLGFGLFYATDNVGPLWDACFIVYISACGCCCAPVFPVRSSFSSFC